MTSSRSKASITKAWMVLVALLLLTGVANAGRKRIVVLEFEGDKAEKFHEDVVKLIKKSHTVVSIDKWNGIAEEMSATRLTDKNVKKVAKKLKVDGVVSGVVEKRRDEYILRMKLRSGTSGELVGTQVNIKSETTRLDSTAAKDVKDELIEVIAELESNRDGGGGSDDDEEKPKKGKKPLADDDDEEKPKKGKKPLADDDEEKPRKSGFGKKPIDDDEEKPKKGKKPVDDDEEKPRKLVKDDPKKGKKPAADDEEKPKKGKKPVDDDEAVALKTRTDDDNPLPKKAKQDDDDDDGDGESKKKKKKKVALKDDGDDDDGGEVEGGTEGTMDAEAMYAPGERAVDAAVGFSFTGRRMSFAFTSAAPGKPAGYKQLAPVPGVYIDATLYPLAIGHKRKDLLRGLGLNVMFDRVILINSENPGGGEKLGTTEQRFSVGAVFRYPLGQSATAPVIGGMLSYGKQQFTIEGMPSVPNVDYSMLQPSAFFNLPLGAKAAFNAELGFMLALDAGQIVTNAEYGTATITGFEIGVGGDYKLTKNLFVRASARLETLGFAFKQNGMKSTGVTGARDTYFGGSTMFGFLY